MPTNQHPNTPVMTYPNVAWELGRDTTGAANSLSMTYEVEPGTVVHATVPIRNIDKLRPIWAVILAELEALLLKEKAAEKARIEKHLEAVS